MPLTILTLRTPERLLVTALRLFWAAPGDSPDWKGGLMAACGTEHGVEAFGAVCALMAAAAYRPLDIHGPGCFCVGCDEIRFLRVLGLLQREHVVEAAETLSEWLPPAAARLAFAPAQYLARALAEKRLHVPLRHPHMTMSAGHLAHANVGMMLVQ